MINNSLTHPQQRVLFGSDKRAAEALMKNISPQTAALMLRFEALTDENTGLKSRISTATPGLTKAVDLFAKSVAVVNESAPPSKSSIKNAKKKEKRQTVLAEKMAKELSLAEIVAKIDALPPEGQRTSELNSLAIVYKKAQALKKGKSTV